MSALSYKAKENAIVVVEDIKLDTPKTKAVHGYPEKLESSR